MEAVEVTNQGVNGYGLLMSALGVGSLIGSLVMASKGKEESKMQRLFASAIIVSLLLVILYFVLLFSMGSIPAISPMTFIS